MDLERRIPRGGGLRWPEVALGVRPVSPQAVSVSLGVGLDRRGTDVCRPRENPAGTSHGWPSSWKHWHLQTQSLAGE